MLICGDYSRYQASLLTQTNGSESGYIMVFYPKVWMGRSPDSVKATNRGKYHAGGGGLIVGRLQHTRKVETIGRSRNVPSLTNKLYSSCYF